MKAKTFTYKGGDGAEIFARLWLPEAPAKAVVQIVHGKAEHSARYAPFAEFLTGRGFAVYANDLRGHGETVKSVKELGYFADTDGWELVVEDLFALSERIRKELPGLPLFLLGHSMGTPLARCYLARHGGLAGCILSGTIGHPGLLGLVGRSVIEREIKKVGEHTPSPKLEALAGGSFNKQFRPARTEFDWISRDTAVVDAYVADPRCGFVAQAGFYRDLLGVVLSANSAGCLSATPRELPILFITGERDPVGANGRKVRAVIRKFKRAGIRDVTARFYPGARHECLNELGREEVYADILSWMTSHLDRQESVRR